MQKEWWWIPKNCGTDSQDILLGNRGLIYDRDYLKPRMAGQTLLDGATLMVEYYALSETPESIASERHTIIHELFEKEISFIRGFQEFMNGCEENLSEICHRHCYE